MSANSFEQKYKNNVRTIIGLVNQPFQDDSILLCDTSLAPVAITLLEVPQNYFSTQYKLYIKDNGNASINNITINAPTGYTINGLPSLTINFNNGCAMLQISSNNSYVASGVTMLVTAGGGAVIDTLYSNLLLLISNKLLIKGCWYRITDYETTYDQPDFDSTGAQKAVLVTKTLIGDGYPLVWVFATGVQTLSNKAFDEAAPFDYVEYDYTYSSTEVMGAPAKGRISRRIDSLGNNSDYDHKVIEFKRYNNGFGIYNVYKDSFVPNPDFKTDIRTFTGDRCKNNTIGDYVNYAKLTPLTCILSNNIFAIECLNNTLEVRSINNTFAASNSNHVIKSGVNALLVGLANDSLTIGANNSGVIGFENANITIGNVVVGAPALSIGNININLVFKNNNVITIGNSNININAGNNNTITITQGFNGLVIGNTNILNLSGNNSTNNKIGDNCNLVIPVLMAENDFGDFSISNTPPLMPTALLSNKFGFNCLNNQDFTAATHVFAAYYCEIQPRQDLTARLKYTDNADAIVVANINA